MRVLTLWWLLELFNPQKVPKPTRPSTRPVDRQVIEWSQEDPLPWDKLAPPAPIGTTQRVWRHTVFLGVYNLESTYESLHRVFGEDNESYDERPAGQSACAGLLVDESGRVVADSAVLSSSLWAVARLRKPGRQDPETLNGFERAGEEFLEAVEKHEGARRDKLQFDRPPPIDAVALQSLVRLGHRSARVVGLEGLAADRIVIQSVAVSARRADEAVDIDFLNSFCLDDLSLVRQRVADGDVGPALRTYLTSDHDLGECERIDVVATPQAIDASVSIGRLPMGRWPSRPAHPLSLSQQFAVNHALNELAPSAGLMGVNGPPGTGKTTMLRDILAGNVVERARHLAALTRPEDAFTDTSHRWTAGDGHPRKVRQLRPELTGFEMLVASANNAAVENVSFEIPARDAIDEPWQGTADYFSEIATAVLRETAKDEPSETSKPPEAWGLVAARLGRKAHRSAFHSAFWFDKSNGRTHRGTDEQIPRMQTRLTQWRDGTAEYVPWPQARKRFGAVAQRVETLLHERQLAEERAAQVPVLLARERDLMQAVERARTARDQAEQMIRDHTTVEQRVETERVHAASQHERHLAVRPRTLEAIMSLGRATRDWRRALAPLAEQLRVAENRHHEARAHGQHRRTAAQHAAAVLAAEEQELARVAGSVAAVRQKCAADADTYGQAYPGATGDGDARQLRAPWLDPELDAARSELFLAALQLHQDFLANSARDMLNGLRAASEVVAGSIPHGLESEKIQAAWQLFFLTIPLVSTTFASADRMLSGMGQESIGWLLIDEAGQAAPQYAAGSIWRARRVVVVGDPLQLQPVVTIPQKAQHALASGSGLSHTWLPPQASVQTLADRSATYGTTLTQGGDQVWVSAPLRVHRRCDNPMFALCNEIAYDGVMVDGVHRTLDDATVPDRFDSPAGPLVAPSYWADDRATVPGSHLQPTQVERLENALSYLRDLGIPATDVIAISPFRDVADHLASLKSRYPGLRAGTIHTAQGREAAVVILVLGGDPTRPGAKAWAASTVNLVNVAASRAQRRLYVIGDRTAWAQHNYFRQLSSVLK
ncbi:DEAD/DEAH box helicase [Occultella kanbiaonis]|uniref:DEAD/DEAH box helicase n=1 Tax=Occultella kanbiaonis TaxID=2675754 RepID=UPI002E2BFA38|nr:AAA domain-containing protein [Occultella kanbiaonis]